jgi:hypothetical protein
LAEFTKLNKLTPLTNFYLKLTTANARPARRRSGTPGDGVSAARIKFWRTIRRPTKHRGKEDCVELLIRKQRRDKSFDSQRKISDCKQFLAFEWGK